MCSTQLYNEAAAQIRHLLCYIMRIENTFSMSDETVVGDQFIQGHEWEKP